jgi:uncharacterized protein with GYD domain
MPLYMTQFSMKAEAWAALTRNPEDRSVPVKAMIEKLGGKFIAMYYTFGEYDGLVISEFPDNAGTMSSVLASIVPGHLSATRTTVLLTVAEAMQGMKKASTASLPRPKG